MVVFDTAIGIYSPSQIPRCLKHSGPQGGVSFGSPARRLAQPRPCVPRWSWFSSWQPQSSECLPSPSNVNTAFLTPPIVSGGKWPSIVLQLPPGNMISPSNKSGKTDRSAEMGVSATHTSLAKPWARGCDKLRINSLHPWCPPNSMSD